MKHMFAHPGRSLGVIAAVSVTVSASISASACYGPHTVSYIDSTRTPGDKEFNHDLDDGRVQVEKCGSAGVARIETYSGWFDMLWSYMSWGDAARSVDVTCAKED